MEPVHLPIKAKVTNISIESNDAIEIDTKNIVINLEFLRKIIGLSSGKSIEVNQSTSPKWSIVLSELLQFLCSNEEIGNETVLLASHAYVLLRRRYHESTEDFEAVVSSHLNLRSNEIIDFKSIFLVYDVALFKLIICHGLLQLGPSQLCSADLYHEIFSILSPDCLRYTRHTYLSFKLLQCWMQRSRQADLWSSNTELESNLEAIIFANWDNAICKSNVVGLFGAYLEALAERHEELLPWLFRSCVERVSWCHLSKYTILAEICGAMDELELIGHPDFVSSLFNSLTISHLCNASSKLYAVLSGKLTVDKWKAAFGPHLRDYVATWEAEKQYNALQVLCKCWLEPTIKQHRELLPFLLECGAVVPGDEDARASPLYRSHLLRASRKYGLVPSTVRPEELDLLDHANELVRLNGFTALCHSLAASQTAEESLEPLLAGARHFLYLNAATSSAYLREGTLGSFRLLLLGLLRRADAVPLLSSFVPWLREFLLDCFEPGASYQRKIFGLQLCGISLRFLDPQSKPEDERGLREPHLREARRYAPALARLLAREKLDWRLVDKHSLVLLVKLVLDPASDVRESATAIVLEFFEPSLLDDSEKVSLFVTALNKCNSCKFFETESGACLFKILTKWLPLSSANKARLKAEPDYKPRVQIDEFQTYAKLLLKEAAQQLHLAKKDILKAATQNTPFYGAVSALLVIAFNDGPERHLTNAGFLEEVINVAEGAVNFFLNALSSKSSNFEYSSSFEEMGLAIEEAIKSSEIDYEFDELVLSPAQQSILTCIWRSLKVLCELAVAIAKSEYATDSMIRRASDLIVTVSLKCRHKGAIESAGVAIANLTRHICKRRKNVALLENHLKRLLSGEFLAGYNLTRRGAGLTILFHRLVASDVRPDRPLLHLALNSLTRSLSQAPAAAELSAVDRYDDPRATRLHFLRSLVADKQLQAQLSPYLEQICLVCFEHIPSPVFTVRNASFQLFGSIVSRLVGQNTGARNVDFSYGHSINYVVTHFPQLAAHLLLSLQAGYQEKKPGHHRIGTDVIHILSLLSKMHFAGCELVDGSVPDFVDRLRVCLRFYLGSPVAHVRCLAAKALAASFGLTDIERGLAELEAETRVAAMTGQLNRLNGCLLALESLHERLDEERRSTRVRHAKSRSPSEVRRNLETRAKTEALWEFWRRRCAIAEPRRLCYVLEAQLLRLSRQFRITPQMDTRGLETGPGLELTSHGRVRPGFFDFVDELSRLMASRVTYDEEPAAARAALAADCLDLGLGFLKYASRQSRCLLLTSVDFALEKLEATQPLLIEELTGYVVECLRSMLRANPALELQPAELARLAGFANRIYETLPMTERISELLGFVHAFTLCNSDNADIFGTCLGDARLGLTDYFDCPETLRQRAATALQVLLANFTRLSSRTRKMSLLAALVMMRDELDSIRETVQDCVTNNVILEFKLSSGRVVDECICYVLILNIVSEEPVIGEFTDDDAVEFFMRYLATIQQHSSSMDIENPFDDDNITPYNEESKIINFILLCIREKFCKGSFIRGKGKVADISDSVFNIKNDLMGRMNLTANNLQDILNIKHEEYLNRKLKVASEVYLQNKTRLMYI